MRSQISDSWESFCSGCSELGVAQSAAGNWIYYLRNYIVTFLIGILFSTPLPWKCYLKIKKYKAAELVILGVILVVSVAYLVDATLQSVPILPLLIPTA